MERDRYYWGVSISGFAYMHGKFALQGFGSLRVADFSGKGVKSVASYRHGVSEA